MTTSLQILAPRPWASRKAPSTYTRPTALHIEKISLQLLSLTSSRNWTHPLITQYISPTYHAEFDHACGVPLHTWKAYVEHHERLAGRYPQYRYEALDSVSDVYDKGGTGSVYMLLRVHGQPVGVLRESIIVLYWERTGGGVTEIGEDVGMKREGKEEEMRGNERWICVGQKVVRGMVWNA